jgi:hypothetical protein
VLTGGVEFDEERQRRLQIFGDEFVGLEWVFMRKEKRRRGRGSRAIYSRPVSWRGS